MYVRLLYERMCYAAVKCFNVLSLTYIHLHSLYSERSFSSSTSLQSNVVSLCRLFATDRFRDVIQ